MRFGLALLPERALRIAITICLVLGSLVTAKTAQARPILLQNEPDLPARDWQAGTSNLAIGSRVLGASFYDLTNNANCLLTLNNKGPVALTVTPTLYNLAGQARSLSSVSVPANGHQIVDLRVWVPVGDTQFEQGSIQLSYTGEELRLGAHVRSVRQAQSISFDEQLVDYTAKFASSTLETAWWLPTTSSQIQLVLSNTTSVTKTATVTVARKGAASVTVPYTLTAHQTRLLDVQQTILSGGALTQLGGITVSHNGQPGNVLARGLVTRAAIGYSAPLEFIDPSMSKSSALHGAGLTVKSTGGQEMLIYAVIRNLGMAATTVNGRVRYTTTSGSSSVVTMTPITVTGGDVQVIQPLTGLTPAQKNLVAVAGIEIDYNTLPGTVYVSAQSVSANGTQALRVPLLDPQAQQSSTGGYPWQILANSSTVVYLKNVTASSQVYTLQLNFNGGIYSPGQKQLAAGQTVAIDVKALRDQQTPDESGYRIPLTADKGQVQWSMDGDDNLVVIGRSEQVDVTNGVGFTYACQNCCPDGFISVDGLPDSVVGLPGGSFQLQEQVTVSNCYGTIKTRTIDTFSRWLFQPNPFSSQPNDPVVSIGPTTGLITFNGFGSSFVYTKARDREWIPTPAGCLMLVNDYIDPTPVDVLELTVTSANVSITPSGLPAGYVSSTQITIQTNMPEKEFEIRMSATPDPVFNGGHHHGGERPPGTFSPKTGHTDSQGKFQTTYTASVFSGDMTITATVGKANAKGSTSIGVGVPNLIELTSNSNYTLPGSLPVHIGNHWGTSQTTAALVNIAYDYLAEFYPNNPSPPKKMAFNDMSLPYGGKFDLTADFDADSKHVEHRVGINCDTGYSNLLPMTQAEKMRIEAIFIRNGSPNFGDETTTSQPHWHLRVQ